MDIDEAWRNNSPSLLGKIFMLMILFFSKDIWMGVNSAIIDDILSVVQVCVLCTVHECTACKAVQGEQGQPSVSIWSR